MSDPYLPPGTRYQDLEDGVETEPQYDDDEL